MECKLVRRTGHNFDYPELIDTLWNVNDASIVPTIRCPLRINRYIMECKCYSPHSYLHFTIRINRYIMECKSVPPAGMAILAPELIDTLWNVNFTSSLTGFMRLFELIDTLWNVNSFGVKYSPASYPN